MAPARQELTLTDTPEDELEAICAMEDGEATSFILPYSLDRHRLEHARPEVLYKTVRLGDEPAGFLILALDPDSRSVELRRIVISQPGRGIGTRAVSMLDDVCRALGRDRVWLDVFESNARARRVYERCGYGLFGSSTLEGRTLLLYQKSV